jgi:hypothetical protein
MRPSSVGWVVISPAQHYAVLSDSITGANGKLYKEFRYQKKQQSSDSLGVKLGKRELTNYRRYRSSKIGRYFNLGRDHQTNDNFRQFSAMSAQFSPNLIINEVGYSASLMRSP